MSANQIPVAVVGQRLNEEFHLGVPGAHALDAFHDPFAYAAVQGQGLGFGTPGCGDSRPQNLAERSAV